MPTKAARACPDCGCSARNISVDVIARIELREAIRGKALCVRLR
jgi:hypothetical protein